MHFPVLVSFLVSSPTKWQKARDTFHLETPMENSCFFSNTPREGSPWGPSLNPGGYSITYPALNCLESVGVLAQS